MDILRYLDILIALAVVMVLLSPMVTALTQLWLWAGNRRSALLLDAVRHLIGQIGGPPAVIAKIQPILPGGPGGALGGVRLPPLPGSTDPVTADLWLPNGLPSDGNGTGSLTLACGPAFQNHLVTLRFIPQRSRDPEQVVSSSVDQFGKATISYAHNGSAAYASHTANVTVNDASGNATAATVVCALGGAAPITLNPTAAAPAVFVYPGAPAASAPGAYNVECTVTAPAVSTGFRLVFDFLRNDRWDIEITAPTGVSGNAVVALPTTITKPLAEKLATAVLEHPMVANIPTNPLLRLLSKYRGCAGQVIEREELIRILLELAANEGAGSPLLKDQASRDALVSVLRMNGIPSPAKALADIRAQAQILERDEPNIAAHIRQTRAIITAAQSDFVGKINNWFDQTMARVTQRYASEARAVTIVSALIAAVAIQIDSLDLIRRLSVDQTLRASLLSEASAQQQRIDKMQQPPAGQPQTAAPDEIEAAKAKRDEIDATLGKLRAPGLAVLPDHFIWQRVPQARLERNPLWTSPWPARYELVAGGASMTIVPKWRDEALADLRLALTAPDVPLTVDYEPGGTDVIIEASEPTYLRLEADVLVPPAHPMGLSTTARRDDLLEPLTRLARGKLKWRESWGRDVEMALIVGDRAPVAIAFKSPTRERTLKPAEAFALLKARIEDRDNTEKRNPLPLVITPQGGDTTEAIVMATTPAVREIRLLGNKDDPFSNVLTDRALVPRVWRVSERQLRTLSARSLALIVGAEAATPRRLSIPDAAWRKVSRAAESIDASKLVEAINNARIEGITARPHSAGALVLTAKRLGALELRYQSGHAESNVLDAPTDAPRARTIAGVVSQPAFVGVLLSWALLSLGAPFWYDALKNLLKLRPAPAAAEEEQRKDRATQGSGAKGK